MGKKKPTSKATPSQLFDCHDDDYDGPQRCAPGCRRCVGTSSAAKKKKPPSAADREGHFVSDWITVGLPFARKLLTAAAEGEEAQEWFQMFTNVFTGENVNGRIRCLEAPFGSDQIWMPLVARPYKKIDDTQWTLGYENIHSGETRIERQLVLPEEKCRVEVYSPGPKAKKAAGPKVALSSDGQLEMTLTADMVADCRTEDYLVDESMKLIERGQVKGFTMSVDGIQVKSSDLY